MLSQLYIKNIAVISEATIDFGPRFNVFTGETGAGKTILVSAINGVLGARLSKEIIRSGRKVPICPLCSPVCRRKFANRCRSWALRWTTTPC